MSWYVNCANCGKQVSIDGPEAKCYWCGKNASKKELTMQEESTNRKDSATQKPKRHYTKRRSRAYWKKHREQVMTDYNSMTLRDFFKTWHFSSQGWIKVRTLLDIPKKSLVKSKVTPPAGIRPIFPEFNDSWSATVKIEWFKAYVDLKKLEGR